MYSGESLLNKKETHIVYRSNLNEFDTEWDISTCGGSLNHASERL